MAKQPARKAPPKTAIKKPTKKQAEAVVSGPREEESMTIRKIKNGYVVRRSWHTGSGVNTKYHEEELFTPTKPVVKV